ncbi:MAG: hypothetical protein IKO27_02340 [Ruminococcus sp.]|nr:hypothetical protein [Ruminococcus sp.]
MKKSLCLILCISIMISFSSCLGSSKTSSNSKSASTSNSSSSISSAEKNDDELTYKDDNSKGEIERIIRDRISSKFDDQTTISSITINEDAGTETTDDYIVLLNLKWDQKNSASTSKEVIKMYSEDLVATVGNNSSKVQEIAIFWEVSYLNTTAKLSYERKNNGMYSTDTNWGSGFNS